MTVFRTTNWSVRNQLSRTCDNTCLNMKKLAEIKEIKCVLLEDGSSDWLQIRTAASSLDVKGNKAIKNFFFSLTGWFSQIRSLIV